MSAGRLRDGSTSSTASLSVLERNRHSDAIVSRTPDSPASAALCAAHLPDFESPWRYSRSPA